MASIGATMQAAIAINTVPVGDVGNVADSTGYSLSGAFGMRHYRHACH